MPSLSAGRVRPGDGSQLTARHGPTVNPDADQFDLCSWNELEDPFASFSDGVESTIRKRAEMCRGIEFQVVYANCHGPFVPGNRGY